MYTCVHAHNHTYTRTHTHRSVSPSPRSIIYLHLHTYAHAHMHTHTYTCIYCISNCNIRFKLYIYIYLYACIARYFHSERGRKREKHSDHVTSQTAARLQPLVLPMVQGPRQEEMRRHPGRGCQPAEIQHEISINHQDQQNHLKTIGHRWFG